MDINKMVCDNIYCQNRVNKNKNICKTEAIENGRKLCFNPPLDEGIHDIVITLITNGVETFESCEGGKGHSYTWPTVRFVGEPSEGLRALSVAIANGLPVSELRRSWEVIDGYIDGPFWEMTFNPPKNSPLWTDRNTSLR